MGSNFPYTFGNISEPYVFGYRGVVGVPIAGRIYSVMLVNPAFTGPCMRVRRSSDNTEQNIGFVSGVLDVATLLSFVGAGDGYVTRWHDQSGNVLDAVQTTASVQPIIVASGVIHTSGGIPSIYSNGSRWMSIPAPDVFRSNFIVGQSVAASLNANLGYAFGGQSYNAVTGALSNRGGLIWQGRYENRQYGLGGYWANPERRLVAFPTWPPPEYDRHIVGLHQHIEYGVGTSGSVSVDNVDYHDHADTANLYFRTYRIWVGVGSQFNGYIQEFIAYQEDQWSKREAIQNSMNNRFNVY